MEHFFYKLVSGVDVHETLIKLQTQHNSSFFLISAVGDLSGVSFKCPFNEKPTIIKKKLEIITLNGYLTATGSHVHISVSDENCSVFGGHLLSGTTVLKSLDILIGVFPNLKQRSLLKENNSDAKVDIYVLPDCPWSKRALKLLDSNNIKYNYHLITNDEEFKSIKMRTSLNTFPQIFINNQLIGGYSELADLSSKGSLIKLAH